VALAAILAGTAAAAPQAEAATHWNFKTDVRTCWKDGHVTRIRTNEDECGWPRMVASEAFRQNLPRYLWVGSHRYKRSRLHFAKWEGVTVRYSAHGMWHNIASGV